MGGKLPHAGAAADEPSWLAAGFDLAGPLDATALNTALLTWIDRHETLRSELHPDGADVQRFTRSPGSVHLRREVVGTFGSSAALSEHLRALFDEETHVLDWPAYVFATVDRPDSSTLCMAFDHGNVDGYSILLVADEIQELYAAARDGRPAQLPEVGSYVDFCEQERQAVDTLHRDDDVLVQWNDFLSRCGGSLPAFPLRLSGDDESCRTQHGRCEWLLDAEQANALEKACRREEGSVYTGALAALALACGEFSDHPVFRALLLQHTRSERKWARSVGWFVGLAPLEIPLGTDFTTLLPEISRTVRTNRELVRAPLPKVAELLETPLNPSFVVSYMDMRASPGAQRWNEWNGRVLHARSTSSTEVYVWINRCHEGIYLTTRYPETVVAHNNIGRFIDQVRRVLRAVATEQHSPSLADRDPLDWRATITRPHTEASGDANIERSTRAGGIAPS